MKRENRQFTKFISLLNFPGLQHLTLWKDSWKKAWRKTSDKHPPAKPTHFKEKQSFSLMNSSSLGWVIAKRESSSKVQRGARMPGQRRAGQLVHYDETKLNTRRKISTCLLDSWSCRKNSFRLWLSEFARLLISSTADDIHAKWRALNYG